MIYAFLATGYILLLMIFVRFFKAVHSWDEEIREMQLQGMDDERTLHPGKAA